MITYYIKTNERNFSYCEYLLYCIFDFTIALSLFFSLSLSSHYFSIFPILIDFELAGTNKNLHVKL